MARVEFGSVARCRRCGGYGLIRHEADKDAVRERARLRRRGEYVPRPDSMDQCPECQGTGLLPPAVADRPRV